MRLELQRDHIENMPFPTVLLKYRIVNFLEHGRRRSRISGSFPGVAIKRMA